MFFNRGKRVLKEYNWLKRSVAWILVLIVLWIIKPDQLQYWLLIYFHGFAVMLWYGSQVKIESISIGFRYSLFFFLFSLAHLIKAQGLTIESILLAFNYIILLMISSWSLPRVKLGLQRIKPVGSFKISIPLILGVYNLTMVYFVNKNWLINLLMSFSILVGFILLYSIYSRKNVIHFIGITFLLHKLLLERTLQCPISIIEYSIIILIYIVFIIIQFYTKPKKKKEG